MSDEYLSSHALSSAPGGCPENCGRGRARSRDVIRCDYCLPLFPCLSRRGNSSSTFAVPLHGYPPLIASHQLPPSSSTMRTVLLLGRQCLRPHLPGSAAARSALFKASLRASHRALFSSAARRAFPRPSSSPSQSFFRTPPRGVAGRTLLFAGAALSPGAFVALSQNSNDDDERTGEQLMLEASRAELKEQVPKAIANSKGFRKSVYFFFENYIWEPLATGLRFVHLVVIFVPVILTVPAIWIGRRVADRDNERVGTLWWYSFLVRSMERAGAAFIKVGNLNGNKVCLKLGRLISIISAWPMGCLANRYLPHGNVQIPVVPPL